MRIGQVAPLFESVPPQQYGGTERVVAYLTEALIDLGHEVTLFASGDSCTRARLVPAAPRALRGDRGCRDPLARTALQLELVSRHAAELDVVHWHLDHIHLPLARRLAGVVHLTTPHNRLDRSETLELLREARAPLASISEAQRRIAPDAGWVATVHHGLPIDLYRPGPGGGGFLLFLGRVSRDKRLDRAIEIARRAGLRLVIAAKVGADDEALWRRELAPLVRGSPHAEFLGEVDDAAKQALLGACEALVFPIDWPEPFGLVLIEAMACGAPVIAWPHGAVPELVVDGVTGWVVGSVDDAVRALARRATFDRARCRRWFEQRFSARRMARDYVAVYERLAGRPLTEAA